MSHSLVAALIFFVTLVLVIRQPFGFNLDPAVLVLSLAIAHSQLTPVLHQSMVYASIIGCDLGPKITPLGSLATLLWLHILAQRGIYIGWGMYFRTGVVLTLPVLVLTLWVSAWMN